MDKLTILITGTPCTGKTTVSKRLAAGLDALYVNLTELAEKEKLTLGRDEKRKTVIVDENRMRKKLREIIETTEKDAVVIDGHYAAAVAPEGVVTKVFVLRKNPVELRKQMEKRGFLGLKLWENLASEILDVCLVEALQANNAEKVCEIDTTGQTSARIANDILSVLRGQKKCRVGCIDWLGKLEARGILEDYLRV